MEQLIDIWVKSNSPCLKINSETSGTNLREYAVTVLLPSEEVKELYFISDGVNMTSSRHNTMIGFGQCHYPTLLDKLESFVKVYSNRAEWLKNKMVLKDKKVLDEYYKTKVMGIIEGIGKIDTGFIRTSHTEIIDSRTVAVYIMNYEGKLIPNILEVRIGVKSLVVYNKSIEGMSNYLNSLQEIVGNSTLVGVDD